MTKTEIIAATENAFNRFSEKCTSTNDALFFKKFGEKWSIAENMQHLIISTKTSSLAYTLPHFLVRWIGGTPNRQSRTFDELKEAYNKKLNDGAVASARFIPKTLPQNYGKDKLLSNWQIATIRFVNALSKNRTEKDLDAYLVKHPLLGRITLRELCYFTIFHTEHHLLAINKLTNTP
jgi:hypothetical protein